MKRFSSYCLLPALVATIVLSQAAVSQACCLFDWWGAYRPTYSAYYAPAYSSYYAPAYSTYYAPSYYTASYVPATTYYASYVPTTTYYAAPASNCCATTCCPSGSCGLQTSYYSSTACCSPCASCVACGTNCCADCCDGNCNLASSSSSSSSGSPTPVTPRQDGSSSQGRTPTFIEEEDRGTGYENQQGTGDGFSPRTNDMMPDPSAARETLKFAIPEPPQETKTLRVNDVIEPVLNLDEKITSRPMPQRTRLIERQSWELPVLAKNIRREVPAENLGWVPVPAPTQLVQK